MEKALINQNSHWQGKQYSELFDRIILPDLIKRLKLKEIIVLQGIRRAGKSTLQKLLINHLLLEVDGKEVLYVNFDDPFYTEITKDAKNIYQVVEIAEKLTGKKPKYLFLDEIQNVTHWEKYVKSVYDNEIFSKIVITGSNSTLLKGDYSNLLSGRYIVQEIFPFSYSEILHQKGIGNYLQLVEGKAKVMATIDNMLEYGGFPEVLKTDEADLKREIIVSYYETILLKDCIARGRIREIKTFKELAHYIISNAASLYSYNSLARAIGSSDGSVKEFVRILENGFLVYETNNYSFSLKSQIKGRKKAYCCDNGFLSNISFKFSANKGKLFENLVYTEFLKRNYSIFFYNSKKECDFIVEKHNQRMAVQVCFDLNEGNRKREIAGLESAKAEFGISEGIIITNDQEEEKCKTAAIPFWKYFFE